MKSLLNPATAALSCCVAFTVLRSVKMSTGWKQGRARSQVGVFRLKIQWQRRTVGLQVTNAPDKCAPCKDKCTRVKCKDKNKFAQSRCKDKCARCLVQCALVLLGALDWL